MEEASAQQRKARTAIVAPIAQRRPCANRSRNGPISGATIANGSIVSPRNSATWSRASPDGTWKNRLPASEIATAASPGGVEDVQLDQPVQPGLAGALGLGGSPRLDHGEPAGPRQPRARSPSCPLARPRPTLRARSAADTDSGATGTPSRVLVPPALRVLGHGSILPRRAPT